MTQPAATILTLPDGSTVSVQSTGTVQRVVYQRGEERAEAVLGPVTMDSAQHTLDRDA